MHADSHKRFPRYLQIFEICLHLALISRVLINKKTPKQHRTDALGAYHAVAWLLSRTWMFIHSQKGPQGPTEKFFTVSLRSRWGPIKSNAPNSSILQVFVFSINYFLSSIYLTKVCNIKKNESWATVFNGARINYCLVKRGKIIDFILIDERNLLCQRSS